MAAAAAGAGVAGGCKEGCEQVYSDATAAVALVFRWLTKADPTSGAVAVVDVAGEGMNGLAGCLCNRVKSYHSSHPFGWGV